MMTGDELYTRCPTCKTVFRTNDAQLSVQGGKVRCGHCRMVFDGRTHLVDLTPQRSADDDERIHGPPTVTLRDSIALEPAPGFDRPRNDGTDPDSIGGRHAVRSAERPESISGRHDVRSADHPVPVAYRDNFHSADGPESIAHPTGTDAAVETSSATEAPAIGPAGDAAAPAPLTSSERDHARVAADAGHAPPRPTPFATVHVEDVVAYDWREPTKAPLSPRLRWGLGIAATVLGLMAIGQVLFHFRHALAAHYPQFRPGLVAACSAIGCTVDAVRRREEITIESHDLQADPAHQGLLILQVTLRNHAGHPVAFPHLELEILDGAGQPQARRALAPVQYAGGAADFARGIPANAEWNVKLFIDASSLSARGYNLDLFYP